MALVGANDDAKMKDLCSRCHKDQAIWFLNTFWKRGMDKEAERLWKYVEKLNELDLQKHEDGVSLDELTAHRFLEHFKDPLTVLQMRTTLRETGAIPKDGKPQNFPLTHFLLAHFPNDWHILVNATQGDNAEEIAVCQRLLNEVLAAIPELQKSEAEAKIAAAEQQKQQELYNSKIQLIKDRTTVGNIVQQNKAKAELAQALAEDPLPLSRAKITADAAAKRAEKALNKANEKVNELETKLHELTLKSGSAAGSLWWIDRVLHEAKQYMPMKKGGRNKDNK